MTRTLTLGTIENGQLVNRLFAKGSMKKLNAIAVESGFKFKVDDSLFGGYFVLPASVDPDRAGDVLLFS